VSSALGAGLRLPDGGRIDRAKPLSFRFDGIAYQGFAGDTLASALLANGVRIVGRSFKLHRPRGLFGSWCEEPSAIVQIGQGAAFVPNLKATQIELTEGLTARSVNCWPSARVDLFAPLQRFSRLMPAGFYYKTFMWPNWRWFEPVIRRAAGLGVAPRLADPDRYEHRHEHCDVLVVGGGPAGLSAALAATRAGAQVVLADDRPVLGGALRWEEHTIDGRSALEWVDAVEGQLREATATRVLTRSTAFGFYDHNLVALCERIEPAQAGTVRERLWQVRAEQVVLATGAIERPIVFANNDLPGVMLTSAALDYTMQYAVCPGRRAVIVTSCDSAYEAAQALSARGVAIVAVVDTRGDWGEGAASATSAGIPVLAGYGPADVIGSPAVQAIEIRPLAQGARDWHSGDARRLECDLVCLSGGWTPSVHLYSQAGGRLRYDRERAALVPAAGHDTVRTVRCAGAANGSFALREVLLEGFEAGREAARACGAQEQAGAAPEASARQARLSPFWASPRLGHLNAWVDLQNDVTRGDLELAVRENLRCVEHVKRYTTIGMAVDQGKTSNMNALGLLAQLTGQDIGEVGATTFRPPYDPVTLGTLAGRQVGALYHPLRRTPIDRWHAEHGAVMRDFGGWWRPAWYARAGDERDACVRRERHATRTAVSLFDASPLGKIELRGADALGFLNRMVYNDLRSLVAGRVRYGVMLNEHGIIIDDGVCMRLDEDLFLVSTTSAGASRIFAMFEEWLQCEWPDLRIRVTDVTSAWGNVAVAGPRARELVQRLGTDIDLAPEAFPHLAVRCGQLAGVPARIARVGLTGELSFEISVPAGYAMALWELALAQGTDLNVAPIGVDALQELRTEKGFVLVGADTDGRTIPADIGMEAVLARKSDDFVGRRSLQRSDATRADRLQLVGIAAEDPAVVLPIGAHVVADSSTRSGSDGYVTSSCASEALGRSVALGLVRAGRARMGEVIRVYSERRTWPARIVTPAWYDPQGERMHA
jgi:sarcosine oxidase, subunit alpha